MENNIEDNVKLERDKPGKLDIAVNKMISRKFLVFLMASIFLIFTAIKSEEWVTLACIYIGMEAVQNLALILKSKLGNKE